MMFPSQLFVQHSHSRAFLFKRKLHRLSKHEDIYADIFTTNRGSLDPRNRRIVVTGSGFISPLGIHRKSVFSALLKGKSGISSLKNDENGFDFAKLGVHYAGQIPQSCLEECYKCTEGEDRLKSQAMKYAEFASDKALEDVGTDFLHLPLKISLLHFHSLTG